MAKHEVTYDSDGVATNEPWSLDDYLVEDGLLFQDRGRVQESVLYWLLEYKTADCTLVDAINELAKEV